MSGFLSFRSILTSKQVLLPGSVSTGVRYVWSIAFMDDLCLAASVLSSDPRVTQCRFRSQQEYRGLYESSVFLLVPVDDGEIIVLQERRA
jgi:hypothetical protein